MKHSPKGWAGFTILLLGCNSAWAQPTELGDAVCVSCHAEPSKRFHSQPSHKKISCANCHGGGAQHVADTRSRPKLAVDAALCASCHAAKKQRGGG